MKSQKEIHAIVVEKDEKTARAVQKLLTGRDYRLSLFSSKEDALKALKEQSASLVVAGEAENSASPLEIMKAVVMTSPMTSMILVTDLPKEEVEEKAEGYGILGHVGRACTEEELIPLLEAFEKILGSV